MKMKLVRCDLCFVIKCHSAGNLAGNNAGGSSSVAVVTCGECFAELGLP